MRPNDSYDTRTIRALLIHDFHPTEDRTPLQRLRRGRSLLSASRGHGLGGRDRDQADRPHRLEVFHPSEAAAVFDVVVWARQSGFCARRQSRCAHTPCPRLSVRVENLTLMLAWFGSCGLTLQYLLYSQATPRRAPMTKIHHDQARAPRRSQAAGHEGR